jgi:hypothetical protein
VDAFIRDCESRWPPGRDEAPWAAWPPARTADAALLAVSWEVAPEMQSLLSALAQKHELSIFDDASERLVLPPRLQRRHRS